MAVCSTVVLVKVAGEEALRATTYGRTALGVSIVQDLLTVVLMVALTALGSGQDEPLTSLLVTSALALGFVASSSSVARAFCRECWERSPACAPGSSSSSPSP